MNNLSFLAIQCNISDTEKKLVSFDSKPIPGKFASTTCYSLVSSPLNCAGFQDNKDGRKQAKKILENFADMENFDKKDLSVVRVKIEIEECK